jgi:hypothetical protein
MAEIPHGAVVITPTEVYTEVRATRSAVDDMRAELRGVSAELRGVLSAHADHETRIRALERGRWALAGVGAGGGAGLAELIRLLTGG